MWPTSTAFDEALLAGARTWATKIEVLYGGDYVMALDVLVDGEVDIDDVAVRRSLHLTLVDVTGALTPVDARDLLAPKGTEIRTWRGLLLPDGTYEYVPLGVFGITEPDVSSHESGTQVKLRGFDRVDALRSLRFDTPWTVTDGTPTHEAIADIVTSRMPNVATRITQTGNTTPEVVFDALSEPWAAVRDLAAADSLRVYFDPLGTLVVEPDVENHTGAIYAPGATGTLLRVQRGMRSDKTYSGAVVRGEHPDYPPVAVTVWDDDPKSPTYYLGPFGKRPYGFTSPLITTTDMATEAANTILARVTRMRQEVVLETVGHPGHDVSDVVHITDGKSRTNGLYTIYGGSIPIRPGSIRWKARESLA